MSTKPTISNFVALKGKRKIVCLTAYSAPMAQALDPHCDLLLVGDSVAMVVYGMDTTQDANLNMMIQHGQAVMRRRQSALVVIDLPEGSYEESLEQALASANEIIVKTGADAVKLEGGANLAPQVRFLVDNGIPVLGHIGLLPQHVAAGNSFRIAGRHATEASQLHADADALVSAGVFGIVMEGIIEPVATSIAQSCNVPTIGIGASAACDGQILVTDDILGLYDAFTPKFVRKFANLQEEIAAAATDYRNAVIDGSFPTKDHLF
ncbi:3-methyl-2-oxobutanoate hydroxymethyltransferase [Candidatus Puniceispirillum sp.]|nr:3-methyl-2-oxobutanoate hydroxymethyltransferase [Candidatus Puniceispirillum sp.]